MSRLARLSSIMAAAAIAIGISAGPALAQRGEGPGDLAPRTLKGLSLDGLVPAPEPILDPQDGAPSLVRAAGQIAA